jgi:hypothetical protein
MALKNGKVNPLNVLDIRRVNKIPEHFQCIKIDSSLQYKLLDITRWIYANLNNRFGVSEELIITDNNNVVTRVKIGFEDPKEISLFMLMCPYLDTKN